MRNNLIAGVVLWQNRAHIHLSGVWEITYFITLPAGTSELGGDNDSSSTAFKDLKILAAHRFRLPN